MATLGVKNIKLVNGEDPAAGDIAGRVELKFDAGNDWAELQLPESAYQRSNWPTISNGTDTDHDIDFAAGRMPDKNGIRPIILSSGLTKQLDAAWVAGDGVGGLFSGTIAADTTYHCFGIVKDSDGTVDAGFDTSLTAANIPTGYTAFRRVHDFETDPSANIKGFTQSGDYMELAVAEVIVSTTTPVTVLTDIQVVPTGSKKTARTAVRIATNAASRAVFMGAKASDVTQIILLTGSSGSQAASTNAEILADSLGEIKYNADLATSITSFAITAMGWTDDRSE